jgi:hypothetical protein
MLMVGFFENLPSERAIAARCEDSQRFGLEEYDYASGLWLDQPGLPVVGTSSNRLVCTVPALFCHCYCLLGMDSVLLPDLGYCSQIARSRSA